MEIDFDKPSVKGKPRSEFSIDDEHQGLRNEIKDW